MEDAACEALVKDVFTTESLLGDTLLNTTSPDILIILLESCGEEVSQFMPRLQQLKREGVNFSRCYGNSWRTDRGTLCTLSGYPSFPTLSVMKMPEKSRMLPSIARTLQKEGYETSFLYGGDINFTNMRSYLISTGWEKLRWKADYSGLLHLQTVLFDYSSFPGLLPEIQLLSYSFQGFLFLPLVSLNYP
jgi:phosphoglycerol transferase MdoB-like AlkP superfamily enzyme